MESNYLKDYNKNYSKNYYRRLKIWLDDIKLKSGCEICGYNKCPSALDFHHKNLEEKEFFISRLRTTRKDKLLEEIKKCQVLCCRCHRELHWNIQMNIVNRSVGEN